MVDGLKLEVTADEIAQLLDERIAEHHANAEADETSAKRLEETDRTDDSGDDEVWHPDAPAAPRLRRRAQRERERKEALTFMRNHLVRGETYRLTTEDLRVLEVLPAHYW